MELSENQIPEFRSDGYLPEGLYVATEAEVSFRFGGTGRRRRLVLRVRRWIELAREVEAKRMLIDGSFITAKSEPDDVDAVVWLPLDFESQVATGSEGATELEQMLLTRRPEELFAAEDETDWQEWIKFFSRTREADGRRKGLVEVAL
ncbi:hypothetical protein Pla175_08820 [Pirellulimonas nuda]|uniref:Polymerase nucleotidyl transferase domain-containing protein n=1 Tax=Pirellulimonas nuda TaxID=2528009 RepID=A0A518D7R7_9BACT|nr:hypothetical protein [Pirellulimonas nuda]QDU87520.1 hypothetical protein Pla175_08820 [Pirellulimonas nuda]